MSRTMRSCAVLVLSLLAVPAWAREVEGTKLDDQLTVEGKTLRLIGAGVRTKWMFSVYVGALYAEKPTFNAVNLLKSEQVKRMELHLLREVGKEKIVESITEGFEKQSRDQLPALKDRLAQLAAAVPDLKKGDVLTLTYLPEKGTVVGGAAKETIIPGKDFADALFTVWLGPDPVDGDLKRKLLGG